MADISVIVPVYNVKGYLGKCLDSLAAQTVKDCEFLCIDDGSTDGSYMLIERYMKEDSRFKLIRERNQGPAETRNVGIRNAQGKYLVFLDADDYLSNDQVLERLFREAEEHHLEIVSFETELFYEGSLKETNDKDFYYYKKHSYEGIREGWSFFVEMITNQEYCDSACLLCVRRQWLLEENISFYPGILYEDALFCMHCFLRAKRMVHLPEKLYTYRIREKSIMTTKARWENVRSRVVLYREILRLLVTLEKQDLQLQKCMADYLSLIASHAKYLDDFRVDEPSDEKLELLDVLLLKAMNLGKYRIEINESVILNGLEKLVVDSEGVILYGAGKVGRLFLQFLREKGLEGKVLCFAISEEPEKKTRIEGIPVLSIREAVDKRGQIFLSVVDQKALKAMEETLRQLGVNRVECFDQYLYRALRHYVQGA